MSLEKFPQKPEKERSAAEIVKDYIETLEKIKEYEIIKEEIENTLREEKKKPPTEFQSERIQRLEDNLVGINRSISWLRGVLREMESRHHPLLTDLESNLYKYIKYNRLNDEELKLGLEIREIKNKITNIVEESYEELKSGKQLTPEVIELRKSVAIKKLGELLDALQSQTIKKNDVSQELRKLEKELGSFMRWLENNQDINFVVSQKIEEWIEAGSIAEAVKKKMRKEEKETK